MPFYTSVYFQDLTERPSFHYDVPGHLRYIWPKAKDRRMIHLPFLKKGAGFCPVSDSVHIPHQERIWLHVSLHDVGEKTS